MRSTLLALLASAAIVSASECAHNPIEELLERTSCGNSQRITRCLRGGADLYRLEDIEQCFRDAGCDSVDAMVGAIWFASECHQYEMENVREELRRRADATTTTSEEATTEKNAKTTTKTATTATSSAESTEEEISTSSTEAKTTAAKTTASSTSITSSASTTASTTASTASPTTSFTSTSSLSTGSITSASASATGTCSVTSTKSTSACSISAGKTISCTATTTLIASCAPGMLCFSAVAGAEVCMKKDNSLTTSGLIVTIIFAVGIFLSFAGVLIVNLRANAKAKHDAQVQLMMKSSMNHNTDVETAQTFGGMRSEANLPLITPEAAKSEQYNYGQQHDYFGQDVAGSNLLTAEPSVAPNPPPKLHPGLGALGQDTHL